MKKARFLFWFALMRCVSSLTKPSVTQFCRFTTMSSHVSLCTDEKKKKKEVFNYPVLSSNWREDLDSSHNSCCSLQSKTLHQGVELTWSSPRPSKQTPVPWNTGDTSAPKPSSLEGKWEIQCQLKEHFSLDAGEDGLGQGDFPQNSKA